MNTAAEVNLDRYARIAGFLFLFYIGIAFAGSIIMNSYHVPGDLVSTRENVQAAALDYRLTILMQLAGDMTAIGLGWSLFVLLRPIDPHIALLALLWRVAEGSIGAMGSSFRLLGANLLTTGNPAALPGNQDAMAALMIAAPRATFPIVVLYFAFGSLLFFYLLVRSGLIPRMLGWLGILGSVGAAALALGMMLLPAFGAILQFLWLPLLVAEVATGLWLLVRGCRHSDAVHRRAEPL
jgi:hypothetical protein